MVMKLQSYEDVRKRIDKVDVQKKEVRSTKKNKDDDESE